MGVDSGEAVDLGVVTSAVTAEAEVPRMYNSHQNLMVSRNSLDGRPSNLTE